MQKRKVVQNQAAIRRFFLFLLLASGLALLPPPAFTAPDPEPCSANSASRQFDFWLGSWIITYPGAPGGSTSKVFLSLDKCLIVESWQDGQGHSGENSFAYNYENKSWLGMFVDNRGHVHTFGDGKVSAGSAEFSGETRNAKGEAVLHRIKVSRVSSNTVEQLWEKSTDNGSTWTTVFRGEYARKTP